MNSNTCPNVLSHEELSDPLQNWVIDHVTTVSTSLNEKLDLMANSLRDMMIKLDYLATDVNRLKGGEGNSNDITEAQSISMFIAGLLASIELSVRMFRPKSFVDAFSLANLQEATLDVVKHRNTLILQTPKANNGLYATLLLL
ncbi:hypothetical protein Tco_0348429 [Tanacetum coccineum]